MSNDGKINYIELPANNLTSIKRFYHAVFDWSFTDYGPEYTSFNDGNLNGGFYKTDARATYNEGGVLIVFYASKLESMLEKVIENNGVVVKAIFSFPGGRRFHFADPNGNELAVWSDT